MKRPVGHIFLCVLLALPTNAVGGATLLKYLAKNADALKHGIALEELAKGIHRPAHWSEDELLQYIEKEIADNYDSLYKILKFAQD